MTTVLKLFCPWRICRYCWREENPSEPAKRARTDRIDFLSLDKRIEIGYSPNEKLGKRSGPRWEQYAARRPKRIPKIERTKRECLVRPNGADRQWVEVPPR